MAGKRSYTLMEQIALMSLRGKITIIAMAVIAVATIGTCTYMSLAKEEDVVSENSIIEEKNEINTIEEAVNEIQNVVENLPVNEQIVEEVNNTTAEKTVTYKGKKVTVPKVEKAAVNDSEDKKTKPANAGTGKVTTVEQAKATHGNSIGIDVSKWNGNIDWAQVKAAGVDFAMIRAGYRGSTVGAIKEDPYFRANIQGAINNGIKVGVYFFSMARNEEEAIQEAAWLVSVIRKYSITYPVVYDLESWGQGRISDVSYSQLTSNAIAFLGYVKSSGYTPMMYASKNDFNNRWQTSRFTGCKFWLAHYNTKTDYAGTYDMWQYTDKGKIPGISGYVDMNVAYFSYSAVTPPQHTCSFNIENITKKATCLEKGTVVYSCECGESKTEELPIGEHEFGEWEIETEATETEEGLKFRVCTVCEKEEKEEIPKFDEGNTVTNTTDNTVKDTNTSVENTTNTVTNTVVDTNTTTDTNTSTGSGDTVEENTTVDTNTVVDEDENNTVVNEVTE